MVGKLNNMTPKQLLKSFCLEGKISQRHGEEIETTITEALRERDELLEEANNIIETFRVVLYQRSSEKQWLIKYYKLLDKKE